VTRHPLIIRGLYKFEKEEEAIDMANDCDVGLGAFIVTESIPRSWRVTEALEVGMVGVNLGLLSGESIQRCEANTVAQVRPSSRFSADKCPEQCLKMRRLC
jgi:hypothetical protein